MGPVSRAGQERDTPGEDPGHTWGDGAGQRIRARLAGAVPAAGGRPPSALVVGVVGARGGAGASVLAAALARTAARTGRETVLVDADPLGGGLDLLLGAEDVPGLRWPDLVRARGSLPPRVVPGGLPRVDGVTLVSADRAVPEGGVWPPAPEIGTQTFEAVIRAVRAHADLLVVDLPRWAPGRAVEAGCDVVHVVVPADVGSVAAASRVVGGLTGADPVLRLVVRALGRGGLSGRAVAEVLGLPLAGVLRPEPGLDAALARREPPGLRRRGPLSLVSRALLEDLDAPAGTGAVGSAGSAGAVGSAGPVGAGRRAG